MNLEKMIVSFSAGDACAYYKSVFNPALIHLLLYLK